MAAAPIIKGATKGLQALANMLKVSPTKTVKKGKGKSGDVIEYILTDKQKDSLKTKAKNVAQKKAKGPITAKQKALMEAANKLGNSKDEKEIKRLVASGIKEERDLKRLTDVDDLGRPVSKQIPPWDESVKDRAGFKKASAAQRRRLINQGFARVNKKGQLVSTKQYADSQENVAETMGIKKSSIPKDAGEQAKFTGEIRKRGGVVKRKFGGQIGRPRGVGAALRGYGKGYK
jgi:hypothetical protein